MQMRTELTCRAATILSIVTVILLGCQSQTSSDHHGTTTARPQTVRTFARTPERLVRGAYLVNGIVACFSCHSPPHVSKAGWPPLPGKEGSGYDYASLGS